MKVRGKAKEREYQIVSICVNSKRAENDGSEGSFGSADPRTMKNQNKRGRAVTEGGEEGETCHG